MDTKQLTLSVLVELFVVVYARHGSGVKCEDVVVARL